MLTFGNIIKQNAEKYKEKAAVIFQEDTLTYSELNTRANKLANAFLEAGYKKGDKVAVLMKNHRAYIEIMAGFSKIGVVIVPINYRLVESEISYIIQHSDSEAIIFTEEYADKVNQLLPKLPQLKHAIIVGEKEENDAVNLECFIKNASSAEPVASVLEEDTFYIGYTSGTTGKPKGVVISQRSRILTAMAAAYEYKIDDTDIHLVGGPIYHAAPWIFVVTQLLTGGTLVIHETFRSEAVLGDMDRYKITNTFLTPTSYKFLVSTEADVNDKYDISAMRVLISAGAPLSTRTKQEILDFFPVIDLHEFYGSTESAITLNIKPDDIVKRNQSVGQPFPFVECLILDDNKQPVGQGEIGELYYKAPYLLDGYYKNPEATAEAFYNGYFTAGDMAMQDEDGFYYVVDRKKDMLISGGVNIYPREIEEVLYQHPDILDAAVIGVPDSQWGESVNAIIVTRTDSALTEREVIVFCKERLASYKKPKSVDFVESLPRNPSGKLLKTALREQYWVNEKNRI
jgi:fatty-acyl-CoA synthase/long-chain acyl-CoA synthetase